MYSAAADNRDLHLKAEIFACSLCSSSGDLGVTATGGAECKFIVCWDKVHLKTIF